EKIDDFLGRRGKVPPLNDIVLVYYANFIPYFASLFAPLFAFISVIYFTSRIASRSEIIAILASGVSYPRLLAPSLGSAVFVACSLAAVGECWRPHRIKRKMASKENISDLDSIIRVACSEHWGKEHFCIPSIGIMSPRMAKSFL